MKRLLALTAWAAFAGFTASPASAGIVYDNGVGCILSGCNAQSWSIFQGMYSAADSFTLSSSATIRAVEFDAWVDSGDSVSAVDWSFLANFDSVTYSGTVLSSGTVNGPAQDFQFTNGLGYDIYTVSFDVPDLTLNSGTYWLELDANSNDNDNVYWDESDGLSSAYHNAAGAIPSESFALLDTNLVNGGASLNLGTPEPRSILLLLAGAGLVGLGLLRRRRQ